MASGSRIYLRSARPRIKMDILNVHYDLCLNEADNDCMEILGEIEERWTVFFKVSVDVVLRRSWTLELN